MLRRRLSECCNLSVQNDYEKPLAHVHFRAEGDMEFRTLLYIPERAPPNFLNDYYGNKAQLKLYVRRVFISDDFEELIPRCALWLTPSVDAAPGAAWYPSSSLAALTTILSGDSSPGQTGLHWSECLQRGVDV